MVDIPTFVATTKNPLDNSHHFPLHEIEVSDSEKFYNEYTNDDQNQRNTINNFDKLCVITPLIFHMAYMFLLLLRMLIMLPFL